MHWLVIVLSSSGQSGGRAAEATAGRTDDRTNGRSQFKSHLSVFCVASFRFELAKTHVLANAGAVAALKGRSRRATEPPNRKLAERVRAKRAELNDCWETNGENRKKERQIEQSHVKLFTVAALYYDFNIC